MVASEGVTHDMEHQGYAVIADYTGIEVDEKQFEGAHKDNYGKVGLSIPTKISRVPILRCNSLLCCESSFAFFLRHG